jgi:hypothetical protein
MPRASFDGVSVGMTGLNPGGTVAALQRIRNRVEARCDALTGAAAASPADLRAVCSSFCSDVRAWVSLREQICDRHRSAE